jgi:hypothetical protein
MNNLTFNPFYETPNNHEEKVKCLLCGLVGARQEITCSTCMRDWRLLNVDVEIIETKTSTHATYNRVPSPYRWP